VLERQSGKIDSQEKRFGRGRDESGDDGGSGECLKKKKMNLHEYVEKLRAKPVRERERIAVIATAVGFAMIFLIWIVSFNEMNKPAETQADSTSASLNDLKNNFQTGKDSIQNMMQQLPTSPAGEPSQALPPEEAVGSDATDSMNSASMPGMDNGAGNTLPDPDAFFQNPDDNLNKNDNNQDKPSVPQLP
jgi:hypothetical protein